MLDLTSKAMLAASIRHGMFASRDTVEEALEYASATIERLYNDDKAAMYSALHVVLNTIANKISALPDSSSAELEPPPSEVRIDHADLPATGAPLLDDRITDIVDQRLARLDIQNTIEKAVDKYGLNIQQRMENAIEEWSENAPFDAIIEAWFEDNVDIDHSVKDIIRNMSISIDPD